ncbi:hypothetical protein [Mycetocola zhujimingii]|uniref:hypothetical protein n=1 Tax=Mycetocola zhujimingii TaxID=2079792 RepID=UPI000D3655C6|nr:hypothetical protein [Mycetocola zhujimingii]AWB87755.1 hypothetical protein C3E77_14875 [Mycetocola zhujimingii]
MSPTSPQSSLDFDPTPLIEPVDPQRVLEHHKAQEASRKPTAVAGFVWIVIVWAVVAFAAVCCLITVVPLFIDLALLPAGPILVPLVLAAIVGAIVLMVRRAVAAGRREQETRYRLDRFAAANGMTYQPRVADPKHPGMIFWVGSGRVSTDVLRTVGSPHVEYGHHTYAVRRGKRSTTYRWGYIAIELGTALPHIVLDAAANNSILGTNLPTSFGVQQRLSLEGDFDRYFELYCPEGYERDALYLFSPDIMARFVDNAALFDIEIVDNTLFLYTGPGISTLNPEMWAWLFGTVSALQTKIDQWTHWRDERLLEPAAAPPGTPAAAAVSAPPPSRPPGVAVDGRRLRRGGGNLWIGLGIIVVGFVVPWLLAD